jgi:hypothetical protein
LERRSGIEKSEPSWVERTAEAFLAHTGALITMLRPLLNPASSTIFRFSIALAIDKDIRANEIAAFFFSSLDRPPNKSSIPFATSGTNAIPYIDFDKKPATFSLIKFLSFSHPSAATNSIMRGTRFCA